MPTPTNYWPPYMGTEFISPHEKAEKHPNLISPEDYNRIIEENPDLYVHPDYMTADRCNNMHFKLEGGASQDSLKQSSRFNNPTNSGEMLRPPGLSTSARGSMVTSGTRGESIYMDAYTGFDVDEEQQQIADHISQQIGGLKPIQTQANENTALLAKNSPAQSTQTMMSNQKFGVGESSRSTNNYQEFNMPKSQAQMSLKDNPAYNINNLPEVDSKRRKP